MICKRYSTLCLERIRNEVAGGGIYKKWEKLGFRNQLMLSVGIPVTAIALRAQSRTDD